MDVGRITAAITEDKDGLTKLAIAAVVTGFAALTTPILIGLVGWSVMLGYQAQIVRRVRLSERHPLPAWTELSALMRLGAPPLLAYFVYLLPNLLVSGCSALLLLTTADTSFTSTGVLVGLLCCLVPLLIVYNAFIMPLYALGMGRYAAEPVIGVFFDFSRLWGEVSTNGGLTFTFLLYTFGFGLVQGIFGAIPIIGWALNLALSIPVGGLIAGQYALEVLGPIAPPKKSRSERSSARA